MNKKFEEDKKEMEKKLKYVPKGINIKTKNFIIYYYNSNLYLKIIILKYFKF